MYMYICGNLLQYHCILDPRSPGMGLRIYWHHASTDKPSEDLKELLDSWQIVKVEDADSYRIYRILQAVPEGMDELEPVRTGTCH